MPANPRTAAPTAPENGMLRKNRGSMSGCSRLVSTATRPTTEAAATVNSDRTVADVQPRLRPSMIP